MTRLEVDTVIETPGDKFVAGYVLYTGQQALSYGGRIKALPMDALWHSTP